MHEPDLLRLDAIAARSTSFSPYSWLPSTTFLSFVFFLLVQGLHVLLLMSSGGQMQHPRGCPSCHF